MKFVVGVLLVILLVGVGGLLASIFPGYVAVYAMAIAAAIFGLICVFVGYKGCQKEYVEEDSQQ